MKFYAYLQDKYGMTREVFNQKPEWAKEELHKEHQNFCRQQQIIESEERRYNNLSEQEKENLECYNNLIDSGIPSSFVDQLFY
jgi:hypothetical protein